jgi:hypothetical protein
VEYDKEEGSVALAEDAVAIDDYLTQPEEEVPWQYVYIAEAAVGALVLGLTAFDFPVFGLLPETLVSFGILVVFAATAVAQYLVRQRRRSAPPELRRR